MESPPTWREFKDDLGRSAGAWRVAPLLPFVSVVLTLTYALPESWWWLFLPAGWFWAGWLGTERIWYLRIFRNASITRSEAWRLTRAFVWRYVRLAVLVLLVWSPVLIVAAPFPAAGSKEAENAFRAADVVVVASIITLFVDFTLTFVTQALAFSTRRVRTALKIGLAMLKQQWPRSAWYAAVPPLAVIILVRLFQPAAVNQLVQIIMSVAATLLNVWFKGATAAFYVRNVEVGDDGAAFLPKRVRRSPSSQHAVSSEMGE